MTHHTITHPVHPISNKKAIKEVWLPLLLFFLASLCASSHSRAQSSRGQIYGIVMDEVGAVLPGVTVTLTDESRGVTKTTITNEKGVFRFRFLMNGTYRLTFELPGFRTERREAIPVKSNLTTSLLINMSIAGVEETITITAETPVMSSREATVNEMIRRQQKASSRQSRRKTTPAKPTFSRWHLPPYEFNTEAYDHIEENAFRRVMDHPLSTFSIDVDTASYSNTRRFLNQYMMPPTDSVRIEELVNYFSYDYLGPKEGVPFSVSLDASVCPWEPKHELVRIGLKGRDIPKEGRPTSNLVFLLDLSGSMAAVNKLALVKKAMRMLTARLNDDDTVAITVYAGASGLVLPPTSGKDKRHIISALERLEAGGSTNAGAGIELAYSLASESFIDGGINRVILCTDGDFNVGITNQGDLVRLIKEKAKKGIFLSVLGFGMGNYKDSTLEKLADKGNGNYAYIDTINEARKVLVEQLNATLFTIAKDVKIQIEFNPNRVHSYRLIGYENRLLAEEDFNDDKKDAGEIGAGHTVTALYELVPAGREEATPSVDALKYQSERDATESAASDELLTIKLRYKEPEGRRSKLLEFVLADRIDEWQDASVDFKFAAAVATFGMMLRQSDHKGGADWDMALSLARDGQGTDSYGYRSELIKLVKLAKEIQKEEALLGMKR